MTYWAGAYLCKANAPDGEPPSTGWHRPARFIGWNGVRWCIYCGVHITQAQYNHELAWLSHFLIVEWP